jgi:hypothetical protein
VTLLHGSSPGFASFHGGFVSFNGGWRVPTDQRADTESRRQTALDYAAIAATRDIGSLIQEGLRARLDRDPPLVGSYRVSLDIVSGAAPVKPGRVNALPEIPFAAGGGLDSIVTRVNKIR